MNRYFLVLMGLVLVAPASNGAIFYRDKSDFLSNITVGQIIDFEDPFVVPDIPTSPLTFGDATFSSIDSLGQVTEPLARGMRRVVPGEADNNSTRLIAGNWGGISIALASGHNALGFDLGALFSGITQGIFNLYDVVGNLLDEQIVGNVGVFGASPSFVGWSDTTADIGRLDFSFSGGSSQNEIIDNVSLDLVSVPEPSLWMLLSAGLAGLKFQFKKKARKAS